MSKLRCTRAAGALLLTLAALGGCASLGGKCDDPKCAQDADVTARVKSAVFADASLRAPNFVYVQTRGGVVYLTGTVATDLQREQAESYARGVKGVEEVVNSITVQSNSR
jgi:osmotically-inducible protein OsmY